jgi:hypothetical protein
MRGVKVFGIGLNKTGTKTLGACFNILGLNNYSYDLELLKHFGRGELNPVFSVADRYDSFEDWPWPLLYRQFDERYPDARFILTLRRDPETWFESLCRHARRTGPTEARKIAYGFEMPMEDPGHHLAFYQQHQKNVCNYFADRPGKLLVITWENGVTWDVFCRFLGVGQIPDVPIPHKNKSTE